MKTYKIILTVHYDEASIVEGLNQFEYCLEQEINRHIGEGLLSPSGEEIIDEWELTIEDL